MFKLQASQYVSDFSQTLQIKSNNYFLFDTMKPVYHKLCYFYLIIILQDILYAGRFSCPKMKNKQLTFQSRYILSVHAFAGKLNLDVGLGVTIAMFEQLQISNAKL